ncbi:N-acetyl-gamma-glutamyl-phosphate reductase [Ferrovum sp. JA12]|uniref:N-acetyl-gamma-glutamyl-phosphate reductase n=1 Tax=Ferrovum sp. JA12 TaxID=1356299 RepID=UPI00070316B8|nr:N-acetyl-gamma-glutamyl-phosphate reductase [Ferrovum sp. JA12]KRH79631.1 N-acetyl-gamma-glutamyl-phosphate reductase [Ferrovum sp. JA12]
MIKVGIVGGTGYTGVELLRLLVQHPEVNLTAITSRQDANKPVADVFPNLRGRVDLAFVDPHSQELSHCDVVFFATPNGIAMKDAPSLLRKGVKVIDLAADFRIKNIPLWEKWYAMEHVSPEWVKQAVYGLPEVNRDEIKKAQLVANPGCYPTAVQLAFIPLIKAGVIHANTLIADAKSGVSGAGRKSEIQTLFSEASDNFKAYGVSGHRHLPEISEQLSNHHQGPVNLIFTPHLTPLIRGIHATCYATLKHTVDLQQLFENHYSNEPFVDVMPFASHPETRSVRASNYCRIALHQPPHSEVVVVLSVIDNLVKGAAGQAVQNMNLMFGLNETMGLTQVPVLP